MRRGAFLILKFKQIGIYRAVRAKRLKFRSSLFKGLSGLKQRAKYPVQKSATEGVGEPHKWWVPVLCDAFPRFSPAFFFVAKGAKKKAWQKRTRRKGCFASAEAPADRGGSDKPLKRLERNFKRFALNSSTNQNLNKYPNKKLNCKYS